MVTCFRRTPYLSEEWTPYIAPIQNFRDQQTCWKGYSQKKLQMEAASNNGIFPPLTTRLDGGFGPHTSHGFLPKQFQRPCPGSKCDNVRMPHCANSKTPNCDHPAPPSKSPLWASSCFTSSFWVTSIFEQYACFQMWFRLQLHVCWWIPESVSNHPVIQHVKNFQRKSWGLWKLCRYKENVRAVLCPAS